MDHVVHINNASTKSRPLVLRLLPGEETIFNLKVVNHGDPSNISLKASSPVFKAVRLRKTDHYVIKEEIIPIMARMPESGNSIDGEILLSGGGRESRVPITLLRDSDDQGDDFGDPGLERDEEFKEEFKEGSVGVDLVRENTDDEDGFDEVDAGEGKNRGVDGDIDDDMDVDEDVDGGIDIDDEDDGLESPARRRRSDDDEDDDGKEPRRISFSRDRDLQSYRSARLRKAGRAQTDIDSENDRRRPSVSGMDDGPPINRADRAKGSQPVARRDGIESRETAEGPDDDEDSSSIVPRYRTRIDDSFVDRSRRAEEDRAEERPRLLPRQVRPTAPDGLADRDERQDLNSGYEEDYQGYRQEMDRESREMINQAEKEEMIPEEPESGPRAYGAGEEYYEQDDTSSSSLSSSSFMDRLDGFSGSGSYKIVPAVIFLALVTVLVLTFIVESIPEFAGALGSSILIVTLIIYGAATLLKA